MSEIATQVGTSPEGPQFDFERHRHDAEERYRRIRPLHQDFCATVVRLLNDILLPLAGVVHSVVARAKEVDSFGIKAMKPLESDPGRPKYKNPVDEITDLSAAMIITYFLDTVEDIDRAVSDQFEIIEKGDRSELLRED